MKNCALSSSRRWGVLCLLGNPLHTFGVSCVDELKAEEGDMGLVLTMMLGFFFLVSRSKEEKRADLGLVEVLLAAVFLLFVFGQAVG